MEQGDSRPVSSFVLRFYALEREAESETPWRIKVTHVQDGCETSFRSMEEVMNYVKQVLGE